MSLMIERISEEKSKIGEGPYWDGKTQTLYYVDIVSKAINRYNPATKSHARAVVGDKDVSFIIPVQGQENTFLIGHIDEIAKIVWDGVSDHIEKFETIVELKPTEEFKYRLNDAKADPSGRLWAGVITLNIGDPPFGYVEEAGMLYALDSDKTMSVLTRGITTSNGLAWNEKLNKFYCVDTIPGVIYVFDYKNLEITNREVLFNFRETGVKGIPDGMTIDSDGNLWIACFDGSSVIKIDGQKKNTLLHTIHMPVRQIASVEFGGPCLEDLYVTTAEIPFGGKVAPEGGWTYKVTGLGVRGVPAREIKL